MADEIRQGNMAKLNVTLNENGVAFTGLAAADSVTVAMYDLTTKAILLSKTDSDANVTLNDGGTGIVGWQIISTDTVNIAAGKYGLAIQVDTAGDILEWDEGYSINLIPQIIANP